MHTCTWCDTGVSQIREHIGVRYSWWKSVGAHAKLLSVSVPRMWLWLSDAAVLRQSRKRLLCHKPGLQWCVLTGTAMRSCRTRKRAIISMSPTYCDNVDIYWPITKPNLYAPAVHAATRVCPAAVAAAVAADCGAGQCSWLKVIYF